MSLTESQIAERKTGVGASEVEAALFDPVPLWLLKTGRAPPLDDSALFRLGHAIEPYIIGECARERHLSNIVDAPDTMRRGRMVAHLDAHAMMPVFAGGVAVAVEAKWRGNRDGFGEVGTADVPRPILLQTMAQMRVAELSLALVPVLFLRPPVAIYDVPYDPELGDMIEAGVERFWWHVEHDVAPDVDATMPDAVDVLRRLYPGTNGERIIADESIERWRAVFMESHGLATDYKAATDVAKAHLLRFMGEAAELKFADGKVFRRQVTKRKGYTVDAAEYVDARFINAKD